MIRIHVSDSRDILYKIKVRVSDILSSNSDILSSKVIKFTWMNERVQTKWTVSQVARIEPLLLKATCTHTV